VRALIFMILCGASAGADTKDIGDVDEELARRHFQAGLQQYSHKRYTEAVKEFEAARKLKPLPAFDYNIGRCYEFSEQWKEAVEAYERYLAASPKASDAVELRERIKVLRERAGVKPVEAPPLPPPEPPPQVEAPPPPAIEVTRPAPRPLVRRPWFWATIGGAVVVVGLAVGLGVGLGAAHDPAATYGHVYGNQ
jgi:tetratricopeptide (TPR) repeat protein